MDENKIISLENLNQYSDETSDKIKSYVNTKTSVIQDGTKTVGGVSAEDYNNFKGAYEDKHTHSNKSVLDEISEKTLNGGEELSGSTGYTVTDSVEYPLVGLKVFGKSTQDGTPTPENPVEITSVVEPTVTISNDTDSSSLSLPNTLNAIPVSSGGNVTIDGQKFIADYVDYERGVKVKRTIKITYSDGCEVKGIDILGNYARIPILIGTDNLTADNNTNSLCDIMPYLLSYSSDSLHHYIQDKYIWAFIPVDELSTQDVAGAKEWLSIKQPTFIYVLATPIETPISESELQAYRQLQTYNGVTNISNNKGAGLSVEYCTNKALSACVAPITTGLQKQIDELKSAVLSLGGNV